MPNRVNVPNLVEIGQTVEKISRFNCFSKLFAAAILDFENFKFLTTGTLERPNLRHPVKFHQDRPIRC